MAPDDSGRALLPDAIAALGLSYENLSDTMWLARDTQRGLDHIVVLLHDTLVTVRVRVMQLPQSASPRLFEDLLRLNADLDHGAYALEDDAVIWLDTLEYPTMDLPELRASLDAAAHYVVQHRARLVHYSGGGAHGNV